jgi:hypothetical protein
MGIYISSSKGEIDTSTMNDVYLQRAYEKAVRDGDVENQQILEEEMIKRGE